MNKGFIKDTVSLSVSNIITLVISMITTMLLSRFRSLQEYGTYSQIMMIISLVTSIVLLGLPHSINYFLSIAENKEEKQKFLNVYYTFSTLLSILIGVILVCITPVVVEYFKNDLISNFIYFLAIYPWAKITDSSISYFLIVYDKTNILIRFRILYSSSILLLIIIVQAFGGTFNAFMLLFLIVESIFAFYVYIIVSKYSGKLSFCIDITLLKRILIFTIPMGISSIIGTLNIEIDKLVIGRLMNTEELAIYTNAAREMPVTFVAVSITSILLPKLTGILNNNDNKRAIHLWGNTTIISYYIICFFSMALIVFAKDVMTILYGEKYLMGVMIFRVYNLLLLLRCTHFSIILNATGKSKLIMYSSIATLGLNCILNYPFFKIFGIIGPAIATLVSQIIINIMQLIFTSKIVDIKFANIFPWKKLLKISIVNIIFLVIFINIKNGIRLEFYLGSIIESILLGIIWMVIYWLTVRKDVKKHIIILNEK